MITYVALFRMLRVVAIFFMIEQTVIVQFVQYAHGFLLFSVQSERIARSKLINVSTYGERRRRTSWPENKSKGRGCC